MGSGLAHLDGRSRPSGSYALLRILIQPFGLPLPSCRLPSPVDAMLEAIQAAQAPGRPALLAAALRLLWGPLALHISSRSPVPHRLAEAFCASITAAAAAVSSTASAAGDSHSSGGSGCPACAAGMQCALPMAAALADLFTHQFATRICPTDAWWQMPPQQALGMLEAVAAAAAACGPSAGCPAGCLHPLHACGASLLRSLHPILDLHLETLRSSLSDVGYAQLVRTACTAEAASLTMAHNLIDGMLAFPEAAAQVAREHLSLLVDAYFSCRHIGEWTGLVPTMHELCMRQDPLSGVRMGPALLPN